MLDVRGKNNKIYISVTLFLGCCNVPCKSYRKTLKKVRSKKISKTFRSALLLKIENQALTQVLYGGNFLDFLVLHWRKLCGMLKSNHTSIHTNILLESRCCVFARFLTIFLAAMSRNRYCFYLLNVCVFIPLNSIVSKSFLRYTVLLVIRSTDKGTKKKKEP